MEIDVKCCLFCKVPILLMLPDTEKILCHDTQSRHKFELTLWAVNDTMKDFSLYISWNLSERIIIYPFALADNFLPWVETLATYNLTLNAFCSHSQYYKQRRFTRESCPEH